MNPKTDHARIVVNPFVIYIGLAVLAVLLQQVLPLPVIPRLLARILGVLLFAANFAIGATALVSMLRAKTSPNPHRPSSSLVVSGVYRFTRNPMYIGLALIYAGLLTFFQITWGLVLLPLLVWLVTKWVIMPEEKYLAQRFGEQYVQYQTMVRRWL